ncbi:hypothetical protein [Streptomyces sp. NBC_01431]|uniref:hypothetical protein n=1 Tax=Streptomyces sp. NBC_01431 TaxID=2903863 RepID=UPI002E353009|nr:hypothetical protein [Streptomyces sp. NBC_01431]
MNGMALTLRALHHGETHLSRELRTVAERHGAEHEVHHVATYLARWSSDHVERIADTAAHYELNLSEAPSASHSGFISTLREKTARAVGRRPEPGLLLLRDLRDLHLAATENSLHWEMLAQAAQAAKDQRLLSLASSCHPQTLHQMRWTNTMIKTLCPQVLTSL